MTTIPFLSGSATCCICGRKITFDPHIESNWTRLSETEDGPAVYVCDLDLAKVDPMSHKYQKNFKKAILKLQEAIAHAPRN